MFKKMITKPIPAGSPTRTTKTGTEVRVRTGGKLQWVPVNSRGRMVLQSSHWYAKVGGIPTKLARDRTAAEQILAAKRRHLERVEAGLELPQGKPSEEKIEAILERWDKEREENDRTEGYRLRQKRKVADLLAELGITVVHQIPRLTTDQIEAVVSKTKVGIRGSKGKRGEVGTVTASAVVRTHNIIALAIFFTWLKKRKLVGVTPDLPQRSRLKGSRAAITMDQLLRLVEFVPGQHKIFYLVAFTTLARRGSLAALRIRDCHFEFKKGSRDPVAGSISLIARHQKTKKPLRVPLAKDFSLRPLYGWILSRRGEGAGDEDLVFTINQDKLPLQFKRQMKKAGLPTETPDGKVTPHSLRHGGASHLLLCGVSPYKVKELGNWKSLDILVRHYGHLIPADATQEVDRFFKRDWNKL